MTPRDRLIVAIDRSDRKDILTLADSLHETVGLLKIGLEAYVANGPGLIEELARAGYRIFLDLKFHDIPNTVAGAVRSVAGLEVAMLTVHAAGGPAMLGAARSALPDGGPLLLGVTILTSLKRMDLEEIGYGGDVESTVLRLARIAQSCGMDGVVASPHEISAIRELCGDSFVIVTPGIRSSRDEASDQRRTMSARQAVAAGATYIVVGRPITSESSPSDAARRLLDELA